VPATLTADHLIGHAAVTTGGLQVGSGCQLMRQDGIAGRAPRRCRKTTIADPAAAARADRIRRDFTPDAAKINARWRGDITYIGSGSQPDR
jgi:hypothetical protein